MGNRRFAVLALVAGIAGCGDNLEPAADTDTTLVVALETSAPAQVPAGQPIAVACTLVENDIATMVTAEVRVTDESHVLRSGAEIIARTAGMVEVSCALPGRGLVDPTPAFVEIVHGPAANVVTTIAPDPVVAGNTVTATCTVYDEFGNLVDDADAAALTLSPDDASNTVTDLDALMTRAGHYVARCDIAGTTTNNAGFDVVPNLPAAIVLARWPDLPVYAVGAIVDITHIVTDRFGNEILEPDVTKTVTPIVGNGTAVNVLASEWRFDGEGKYHVVATVNPPTDADATISASLDIVVNSRGPAISCTGDASMIQMVPGSQYTVVGNANDANGVSSLTVNGNAITVAADGAFSAPIVTRYGINFVDITATDSFGEPTTKVCTFLVSQQYASTSTPVPDAISLKLTQSAIDDSNRTDGLDSLADILYTILNSTGLSNTLHSALLAANPLKPSSCDQDVCVFGACACVYSSQVNYLDRDLPGPNTVTLALTNGGITATAHIPNVSVKLRVNGKVTGISYDTTGWVRMSYVDVSMTLDLALTNGRPDVTVRPGSVTASVGTISTDFNGIDGWIINNIVVPLAQNQLRNKVRDLIRDYITGNFNAALDGVIGNLDIANLGATFNVPRLDTGTVAMSFGLGFSTVTTTGSRLLFGIGTKFSTTPLNAFPSLGVPMPSSPAVLADPTLTSPANTAVAAHVGVLEGALHALWRANYFAATLDGSAVAGLPAGVSFVVNTRLPPVVVIQNNGLPQLQLGALDLTVSHPSLPPNLTVTLGADAHTSVNLVGNDLVFGNIVIDTIHVSTDTVNLSAQQQQDLQGVLMTLLQSVVDSSLNDVLPAIPIPSFPIPASLGTFGLPVGAKLGIVTPSLTVAPQHFTLRGQFGIQ